jgi:hypothetical protein
LRNTAVYSAGTELLFARPNGNHKYVTFIALVFCQVEGMFKIVWIGVFFKA